jgi:flavin reductase ActVB
MSRLATGVAVVTTRDQYGNPHGLTVNSFCSVSLDPPLVLVCVARGARCFPVFNRTGEFAVSILSSGQEELARRFASSGADKFGGAGLVRTARGGVLVAGALATVECVTHARHDAGDHEILIGEVVAESLATRLGSPAVYFDRRFVSVDQ